MRAIGNVMAFAGLVSMFGGFICLLWWAFFNGPEIAGLLGFCGLPAAFIFGNLIPREPTGGK